MKKALALTLIGALPLLSFSQSFIGYNYDNYAGVHGMVFNPASVAGSKYKVHINLLSMSSLVGNNAYEVQKKKAFNFDFDNMDEGVDYFKSANTDKKNLWHNTDILGPSFMINTGKNSAFGIYTRARVLVNEFNLSDRTFRFINTDDGFYNTNIQEQNVQLKGHAFGEAGISYGRIVLNNDQHLLKVGVTGKYVVGIGAAAAYSKNVLINIAPSDIINQMSGDFTVRYSASLDDVDDTDFDKIFDRESGNNGFGFDLGLVYQWKPVTAVVENDKNWLSIDQTPYKLRLSASITDIGSVKYKNSENGNTYTLNGTGHPTAELEQLDGETVEEYFDRLQATGFLTTQATTGTMKVKLPTALRVDADYHLYKRLFVNVGTVVNMINKNKNEFSASYTTSFTVTPRLEKKWISIYSPVYYNMAHKKLAWGAGIRMGPIFAGSGSVLSNLLGNKNVSATDAHIGLTIPIYQRKKREREPKVADIPPPPPQAIEAIIDTTIKAMDSVVAVNNDRDFDGVLNDADACPDTFGEAWLQGCPDADKDSIADILDKCPTTPGLKRYNGCPIPDTDGDGLNDEEDKCPAVAGKRELQGCPEVKQEVVKKINTAAKSIYFLSGKDVIQPVSFPKLDTVVSILQADADLHIAVEGHTDNTGSALVNDQLSEKRAQAVKAYLVSKGIDEARVAAKGFGSSRPVVPNSTPAGRSKNRRVELHLSY